MSRKSLNPFTPAFGRVPYALVGRDEFIDDVVEGLANTPGDPNRSTFFIGPRGSGKTVLLSTIANIAAQQGWICVSVSASDQLFEEFVDMFQRVAGHLLKPETKTYLTSLTVGPLSIGMQPRPVATTWRFVLTDIIQELNDQGVGVLFCIDEIIPTCQPLIYFISSYQHFVAENRDVALLLAGLPSQAYGLMQDQHVSFIRRAFQRTLGPISQFEVEEALEETITENGRAITPDALQMAAQATGGFAFAIQVIGYYLWRYSQPDSPITTDTVQQALPRAHTELENAVVVPTLQELSKREIEYLHAMAQDDGASSTSEVAHRVGISTTNGANLRHRLIDHRVITETSLGKVDFEIPLMRNYLRTHLN